MSYGRCSAAIARAFADTMTRKMWQRAVADLDPPGVPNSFRRAHEQQNIARVLMQREAGGARRPTRLYGETQRENFWAEGESAAKVRTRAVEAMR